MFGKKHGKGTFVFSSGYKYEGDWVNDAMEGQGSLFYPNGALAYEGRWKHGKIEDVEGEEQQ